MARRSRAYPVILEVRRYVGRIRRRLVLEMKDILFFVTPFATGHARSNWIPSLGPAHRGVVGSREAVSYAAQERGVAAILAEPPESRRVANLSNDVGYIRHLNDGSSAQAGAHFIEAAVAQAIVNVRGELGRLKRAKR